MTIMRCPITYELIKEKNQHYSSEGLKKLSRQLKTLADLPFTENELREEAKRHSFKMSIQGVQAKLSAVLNIKAGHFSIVDQYGKYILKPPIENYPETPANEDLTMRMATLFNIEVPLHGLLYNKDKTFTYFIKRFDRIGHKDKLSTEDFAQLSENTRDTKYNFSMEKLIPIIDKYCTFPLIEKNKLFIRLIFNYLIGNEDMHLKNFSLLRRKQKIELAPAYDFLNTTIAMQGNAREEFALPINGKKSNITRKDLIDYYAENRLGLNQTIINTTLLEIKNQLPNCFKLIEISFLSEDMKLAYKVLLEKRMKILDL